ncbi:MAG TPA: extracellular solute-binding protein [Stellaceae bacterium]|nr:extracellular solute-binding protein [Stellaceae bacterium]
MMQTTAMMLALLLLAGPAWAADTVDMAAAKREGSVRWYTSTPIAAAQSIANSFEKATGIKVELFRSGGSAVLSRFMQELNAGAHEADVITTSDPAAAATLTKRGIFVAFKPANFDKIPAEVKDPDGYWIAQRLNLLAIAVKGDAVKPADRPKTWSDLTEAKYKGLEVMPDPSFTSLQLVAVGTLSKSLGWGFYEKLKRNDIMIVQGHQQVEDMVKRGERPIAAEELDSYAADDRKKGQDIVTIYPTEGVFAIASPTAIVKGGPHPNAAKALAEYMIGDAVQETFPQQGIYAARIDAPPPPGSPKLGSLKLMAIDFAALAASEGDIKSRFNEIFQ